MILLFFYFFHKPVSFTEADLCMPPLPGGSSVLVMDGCEGLHRVSVNFNHIKVSQPSLKECRPRMSPPLCCPAVNAAFHHVQPLFKQKAIRKASINIYQVMILSVLDQSAAFKPLVPPLLTCLLFLPQWETITNHRPTIRPDNSLR